MRFRLAFRPAFLLAVGTAVTLAACSGGSGQPEDPIRGAIGATSTPSPAPAITPTPASTPATPVASSTPKPSASATATATATAAAAASATPTPTATQTGVATNTCASPLPAGPSNFYSASASSQENITVYAGDFTGSSTASYEIAPLGGYSNGMEDDLGAPFTLALGPNGNVYTLEYPPGPGAATSATVAEYLPNFGCMPPIATLNGLPVGGNTAGAVAVDASGYVYVASQTPRQLALYAPLVSGAQTPNPLAVVAIPSLVSGSSQADYDPIGIALDASGRIYIANGDDNSILVYPARNGGTLTTTPTATIEGSMTGLLVADGVAVDKSGKIYVSDESYAVKLFAANPSGTMNEAPIAQITGSQTQITGSPLSIALDHLGVIYVGAETSANYDTILEFPPNPSGTVNEAPQGMLVDGVGVPTGLVGK